MKILLRNLLLVFLCLICLSACSNRIDNSTNRTENNVEENDLNKDEFIDEGEWSDSPIMGVYALSGYYYVPKDTPISENVAKDLEMQTIIINVDEVSSSSVTTKSPVFTLASIGLSELMDMGFTEEQAIHQIGIDSANEAVVYLVSDTLGNSFKLFRIMDDELNRLLYVSNTGYIYYLERINE
ncbi:hypothetical protein LJC42_00450 [Eubacteriales bacterium OttesenSCG-928-K08]|nr:hypothetical protein [Eubacteriales bacterium OttesenSCG-928-K08]